MKYFSVGILLLSTLVNGLFMWTDKTHINNWEYSKLHWWSIDAPGVDDWIGVYSPPEALDGEFLSYFKVGSMKSADIQLYDIRAPYEFRYYKNYDTCDKTPEKFNCPISAKSNTVFFTDDSYFQQVHISLTPYPDEMMITVVTPTTMHASIEYGTKSGKYSDKMSTNYTTYTRYDMCSEPANETYPHWYSVHHPGVGYIHTGILYGLQPNTQYFYRFSDNYTHSQEYNFTTMELDNPDSNIQMILYADQDIFKPFCDFCSLGPSVTIGGGAEATMKLVDKYVAENNIGVLQHVGDLSYARGVSVVWDLWSLMIQNTASQVPYMVSIGNHEYDYYGNTKKDPSGPSVVNGYHPSWGNFGTDSGGECGVPVFERFPYETNGNSVFWYSFDYSNVHSIMISSEHNFTKGSNLYNWLEKDLASVNRTRTPWVFLSLHRPIYMSEVTEIRQILVMQVLRAELEPLLYKYNVDIVFQGHMHMYERTTPVYQYEVKGDTRDPKATIYITLGAGGISLDSAIWDDVDWSEYHENKYYGFAHLNVVNSTYLEWKFINSNNGNTVDQFNLTSKHSF